MDEAEESILTTYLFGKYLYGGFFGSKRLHRSASPGIRENFLNDLMNIKLVENNCVDRKFALGASFFLHSQF